MFYRLGRVTGKADWERPFGREKRAGYIRYKKGKAENPAFLHARVLKGPENYSPEPQLTEM